MPGTLDEMKSWGITNVELAGTYNLTPEQFRAQLDADGLNAFSGHFPYERLRDDVEGIAQDAQILGLKYVGCAWIPHDDGNPFDEKTCREAIEVFNQAGEALGKAGVEIFLSCAWLRISALQGRHAVGFDDARNQSEVCELSKWTCSGSFIPARIR